MCFEGIALIVILNSMPFYILLTGITKCFNIRHKHGEKQKQKTVMLTIGTPLNALRDEHLKLSIFSFLFS